MTIRLTNDRGRQLGEALAYAILAKSATPGSVPFTWLSILNEINQSKAAEVRRLLDTPRKKGN